MTRITRSPALPPSWLFGIDSGSVTAAAGPAPVALTEFVGGPLIRALGLLSPDRILGPWSGWLPAERRAAAKFVPALYGDDHAHEHPELCQLLEGQCLFSFGRKACVLEKGDLVVLPGGMVHAEAFLRPAVGYKLAWWSLHPTEPNLHVTSYSRMAGFVIEHGIGMDALPAEAQNRLQVLQMIASDAQPPAVDRLREALLTLALLLFRRVLDVGEARLDTRTQLVRRAIQYVRDHTDRPLTLTEVARAVRVSPNYLTGLFRSTSGVPLGRFIIEERIAAAQVRLRQAGMSVKSVAIELGFADPYAFSKAFKRVVGSAPRVWQANQEHR